MEGLELASKVSTKEPYLVGDENSEIKISALDIGIKMNILRNLERKKFLLVFAIRKVVKSLSQQS